MIRRSLTRRSRLRPADRRCFEQEGQLLTPPNPTPPVGRVRYLSIVEVGSLASVVF
jgi:hypothetical protein